jgi:PhnB protein
VEAFHRNHGKGSKAYSSWLSYTYTILVVEDTGKAIDFYKRAFGAKEIYGNYTPDGKSIIYAEIKTGDSVLMMSDELPHSYC